MVDPAAADTQSRNNNRIKSQKKYYFNNSVHNVNTTDHWATLCNLQSTGQEGHSQIKFKFIANKVPFYDSTGHGWLGDDGPVGNTERAKQSGAKKKKRKTIAENPLKIAFFLFLYVNMRESVCMKTAKQITASGRVLIAFFLQLSNISLFLFTKSCLRRFIFTELRIRCYVICKHGVRDRQNRY